MVRRQCFDPEVQIVAVILNRVGTPSHAEWLKKSLLAANCKLPVVRTGPPRTLCSKSEGGAISFSFFYICNHWA